MNLDPSYLLYLGIDGPSVNKSFEDKLLTNIHSFLKLSIKWFLKPIAELVALDVNKKANLKSLKLIEIGTKRQIGLCLLVIYYVMSRKIYLGRNDKFYAKAVSYVQENLPFDVLVPTYLQYLHPEKRNNSRSTDAICNLAF